MGSLDSPLNALKLVFSKTQESCLSVTSNSASVRRAADPYSRGLPSLCADAREEAEAQVTRPRRLLWKRAEIHSAANPIAAEKMTSTRLSRRPSAALFLRCTFRIRFTRVAVGGVASRLSASGDAPLTHPASAALPHRGSRLRLRVPDAVQALRAPSRAVPR